MSDDVKLVVQTIILVLNSTEGDECTESVEG